MGTHISLQNIPDLFSRIARFQATGRLLLEQVLEYIQRNLVEHVKVTTDKQPLTMGVHGATIIARVEVRYIHPEIKPRIASYLIDKEGKEKSIGNVYEFSQDCTIQDIKGPFAEFWEQQQQHPKYKFAVVFMDSLLNDLLLNQNFTFAS